MKLSKLIPARTMTVKFNWVRKDFTKCSDRYRAIRKNLRRNEHRKKASMTYCDWCKREFEKDEPFALAQPKPKQEGPRRNWALCHKCVDLMVNND